MFWNIDVDVVFATNHVTSLTIKFFCGPGLSCVLLLPYYRVYFVESFNSESEKLRRFFLYNSFSSLSCKRRRMDIGCILFRAGLNRAFAVHPNYYFNLGIQDIVLRPLLLLCRHQDYYFLVYCFFCVFFYWYHQGYLSLI